MKRVRRPLATAAAVVVALVAAGIASASPPIAFTGTFTSCCSVVTSFRQADGNTFISVFDVVFFAGDFAGTATEQFNLVFHPDGSATFNGTNDCTCTVAGRSGTIATTFAGNSDPSGFTIGYVMWGGGSGGLANLHAVGTFHSSNGGGSGSFSGVYHFDP